MKLPFNTVFPIKGTSIQSPTRINRGKVKGILLSLTTLTFLTLVPGLAIETEAPLALPAPADSTFPSFNLKSILNEVAVTTSKGSNQTIGKLKIQDVTSGSQGDLSLAGFSTQQTQNFLIVKHSTLDFFQAEVYEASGKLVSEHRSSRGFSPRLKIPLESLAGKIIVINLKNAKYQMVKTLKISSSESAYSSKD